MRISRPVLLLAHGWLLSSVKDQCRLGYFWKARKLNQRVTQTRSFRWLFGEETRIRSALTLRASSADPSYFKIQNITKTSCRWCKSNAHYLCKNRRRHWLMVMFLSTTDELFKSRNGDQSVEKGVTNACYWVSMLHGTFDVELSAASVSLFADASYISMPLFETRLNNRSSKVCLTDTFDNIREVGRNRQGTRRKLKGEKKAPHPLITHTA